MDVTSAVNDLNDLVEMAEGLSMPNHFSEQESALLLWFIGYFIAKLILRVSFGGEIWDYTSIIHQIITVSVGIYDIIHWDLEEASTCLSLNSRISLTIGLQLIHCLSEVVYIREMIEQPIFLYHHLILGIVALVLPYCPGCYFTTIAIVLAEAGSASLGVDYFWRKFGGNSRGFKRVVVFGGTRLVNLALLYRIWLVTPSSVYFTISTSGEEVITFNFPICMITSIGGSVAMLINNGITWNQMWRTYKKNKKKRQKRE